MKAQMTSALAGKGEPSLVVSQLTWIEYYNYEI